MTSLPTKNGKALKAAEGGRKPDQPNGVCNGGFVADDTKPPAADAAKDAAKQGRDDEVPRGRYLDGLRALRRRETLWPLMLVIAFFVIHHWTGLSGLRPFMVPVFRQFGLPVDAHWLTVRMSSRAGKHASSRRLGVWNGPVGWTMAVTPYR